MESRRIKTDDPRLENSANAALKERRGALWELPGNGNNFVDEEFNLLCKKVFVNWGQEIVGDFTTVINNTEKAERITIIKKR